MSFAVGLTTEPSRIQIRSHEYASPKVESRAMIRNPHLRLLMLSFLLNAGPAPVAVTWAQSGTTPQAQRQAIKAVLTDFHRAASEANGDRYFGHLAADVVFLGTDATERFSLDELQARARPYFSRRIGWTHLPTEQHVFLATDSELAWFDERLDSQKFGEMRGSGVLRNVNDQWKIVQYNLTLSARTTLTAERGDANSDIQELVW